MNYKRMLIVKTNTAYITDADMPRPGDQIRLDTVVVLAVTHEC